MDYIYGLHDGLYIQDYTKNYIYGTTRRTTYTGLHGGLHIGDYTVNYIYVTIP